MLFKKHPERSVRHLLSAPFIYSMIFPLLVLHVFLEIYHQICFRLYGIPLVRVGEYIVIDRHRLAYLSAMEKINCVYCGYANGLLAYAVRVAGDTEAYWCGIKHKQSHQAQAHHATFIAYGNQDEYKALSE